MNSQRHESQSNFLILDHSWERCPRPYKYSSTQKTKRSYGEVGLSCHLQQPPTTIKNLIHICSYIPSFHSLNTLIIQPGKKTLQWLLRRTIWLNTLFILYVDKVFTSLAFQRTTKRIYLHLKTCENKFVHKWHSKLQIDSLNIKRAQN